MSARPTFAWAWLVATLIVLSAPQLAQAGGFGPIALVSKSPREQAAIGTEPALSADGRYVAFCAELGGREGIFREQLETGQVTPVAVGPIELSFCGTLNENTYARGPSLSADGRYVSFTTKASLVEGDKDGSADVYVADMATTPPSYELASVDEAGETLEGGSTAAGIVALSSDGTRVAFVNRGNVYVRDLGQEKTILISSRRDPITGRNGVEPVVGGGAYASAGASISADGSTVAWVGEHLPEQVPLSGAEEKAIETIEGGSTNGHDAQYHEPLWRRVPTPAEEVPQTRRIVGCRAQETPCGGPFPAAPFNTNRFERIKESNGSGWGLRLPRLDGDGEKVALVGDPGEQYDLFVVEMAEGLSRSQAIHQVTQWTNPAPTGIPVEQVIQESFHPEYLPFTGEIAECAISLDGTRVAFASTRQQFSTRPYTLVSELPSAVGRMTELYELNLETNTIERATPGPGKDVSTWVGTSPPKGVASISFGDSERLLGFSSAASNLVAGDANEGSDAFVVESIPPADIGASTISPRPPQFVVQPAWRMTANAYSRPDGSIRVIARVPGQGTLSGSVRAQLGGHLKSRRVAAGRQRAQAAGTVMVDLSLGKGRRSLARKPGLIARVHVTFTGRGGRPLHVDLQSRFLVHGKRKAARR